MFLGSIFHANQWNTHPKFNIAPEKWWLEDYFPIGKVNYSGAMLNFGRVYSWKLYSYSIIYNGVLYRYTNTKTFFPLDIARFFRGG